MTTELKLNQVIFPCKQLQPNQALHWADWLKVLMTGNQLVKLTLHY